MHDTQDFADVERGGCERGAERTQYATATAD